MTAFNEATIEDAALDYLRASSATRPRSARTSHRTACTPERATFEQVYLYDRLREAARRINPEHR